MSDFRSTKRCVVALAVAVGIAVSLGGCLGPNRNPIAVIGAAPLEGYEPFVVHLSASGSYDPDGDALSYAWSFDDGGTGNGAGLEHTFDAGQHVITLTVTDDRGAAATTEEAVAVEEIPDGYIAVRREWTCDAEPQYWDVLVPWNLYQTYRSRIRNTIAEAYEYGDYVEDPLDDPTIDDYATALWNRAGGTKSAFVDCVLAFVQGAISYQQDPTGQEWPLYPIETLVDGVGDCEDTTILFVSLLLGCEVHASVAFVDTDSDGTPDHVLALVPVTPSWEARLDCDGVIELDGVRYAVAETATDGEPLSLGCDPWNLSADDVYDLWSF